MIEEINTQDVNSTALPENPEDWRARYEVVVGNPSLAGSGNSFIAVEKQSGTKVFIKTLSLFDAESWKSAELFERETAVLKQLNHPRIARYIDAFSESDAQGAPIFYLVQEFVEGNNLQTLLDRHVDAPLFDEEEARAFMVEMLEVLQYLNGLHPPVTHRDISPENIIRRADGTFVLVGFSSVQAVLPQTMTGSTFVGTAGYMAPEQLMGRAVPSSDLFSLGATTIHLLSGMHPGHLPVRRMQIDFARAVECSDDFKEILRKCIAPRVEDRYETPRAALLALDGIVAAPISRRDLPEVPEHLQMYVKHSESGVIIRFPLIKPGEQRFFRVFFYITVMFLTCFLLVGLASQSLLQSVLLLAGGALVFAAILLYASTIAKFDRRYGGDGDNMSFGPTLSFDDNDPDSRVTWKVVLAVMTKALTRGSQPGIRRETPSNSSTAHRDNSVKRPFFPGIRLEGSSYFIDAQMDEFFLDNGRVTRPSLVQVHQGDALRLRMEVCEDYIFHPPDGVVTSLLLNPKSIASPGTVWSVKEEEHEYLLDVRLSRQDSEFLKDYLERVIAQQRHVE